LARHRPGARDLRRRQRRIDQGDRELRRQARLGDQARSAGLGAAQALLDRLGSAPAPLLPHPAPLQFGLYGEDRRSVAGVEPSEESSAVSLASSARSAVSLVTASGAASRSCRAGKSMIIAAATRYDSRTGSSGRSGILIVAGPRSASTSR